jgi:hypothetical protein
LEIFLPQDKDCASKKNERILFLDLPESMMNIDKMKQNKKSGKGKILVCFW